MRRKYYDEDGKYGKQQMKILLWNWRKYNRIIETRGRQTLFDVYVKPSWIKKNSWNYCIQICKDYNGFGLSIIQAKIQLFTAGFEFYTKTKELYFVYITKEYNRIVKVDDLIKFAKLLEEEKKDATEK